MLPLGYFLQDGRTQEHAGTLLALPLLHAPKAYCHVQRSALDTRYSGEQKTQGSCPHGFHLVETINLAFPSVCHIYRAVLRASAH